MPMPDIPSNSIRNSQPEQKKRVPATNYAVMPETTKSTAVKKKEKSKILSLILPEDVPDLTTYLKLRKDDIIKYIIFPSIRDTLLQSLSSLLGITITAKNTSNAIRTINRVSYNYNQVGQNTQRSVNQMPTENTRYSLYQNIGFDSAEEADEFMGLVEDLFDDQGGWISVLQFYNIANRKTSPEQNNYGWLSIGAMKRIYSGGRYYIDMPWPVPLDT